jgi:hypothetical protein
MKTIRSKLLKLLSDWLAALISLHRADEWTPSPLGFGRGRYNVFISLPALAGRRVSLPVYMGQWLDEKFLDFVE